MENWMKGKKLYVGSLSYSVTQETLQKLFAQYGEVVEVKVIGDKGFAFVEMSTQAEAENAKANLNDYELEGRNIKVDEARPKNDTRRSGGFKRY